MLPNLTFQTWLDNFALHNSVWDHVSSSAHMRFIEFALTSHWRRFVQSLGFRLFANLEFYISAEVVRVIWRAALTTTHGRWRWLLFDLVLKAHLLIFDGQAFAVEALVSENVA